MFKSVIQYALAASVALFPIASASASHTTDPLSLWVAQVNRQIDDKVQAPLNGAVGVAKIRFRRGEDGRASEIVVLGGQPSVALAAARTLRKLKELPPLPAGLPSSQRITMNFLIGDLNKMPEYVNQRARMLASATVSNTELASRTTNTRVASIERR